MNLEILRSKSPKPKPDEKSLGFGKIFTDHMFTLEYKAGKGWHNAQIRPFENFSLSPACNVFHYSQTIFDGLKGYHTDKGINLFRPWDNFARLNVSAKRLCIPEIDEKFALEALKELVTLDKDWVPKEEGTSLYIRPTIIAVDPFLGVKAGQEYIFYIILSPVGAYYASGLAPVDIYVEDEYVRAVVGGTGFAKTGANYAISLLAAQVAHEKGYDQVLWLDGVERKYVEEVGAMNIFFKIRGELYTPPLKGPGVAALYAIKAIKDNCIQLNKKVRLLFGTDEETTWQDMDFYKQHGGQIPDIAFSPDG
ncbi:MAG TPA: branched-chain amino acid aminotransferase, partial [Ignavibacteriales bacterium]|nr:branched-chain amino acid aminotransferase [Ignavibacteriales bacterium]